MTTQYIHTQRATFMLVAATLTIAFIVALFAWIGIVQPKVQTFLALVGIVTLALLVLLAWYFSSMTVVVTDDEVRWHFGPGRDWRIARADIEVVEIAPHSWLGGYGIRWFGPNRWVYIVSGRNTVEMRLKQGGWRRLGTDDPEGLLKALSSTRSEAHTLQMRHGSL